MRLQWGFRRRRVGKVVRSRVAGTRCSEKRRRRLWPSRRIARADVRMEASAQKRGARKGHRLCSRTEGEGRPGACGGRERGSRGQTRDGFGQRGDKDRGRGFIVAPASSQPPVRGRKCGWRGGAGEPERPKAGLGKLVGFAGPRKARGAAALAEAGAAKAEARSEAALGKPGNADAGADTIVARAADGLARRGRGREEADRFKAGAVVRCSDLAHCRRTVTVRDSQNRDGTTGDKAGEHTDHERPVGLKVTVDNPYKL